ncbi:MAG: hypothetical protein WDO24_20920 [Pseudomonadota bacterium]
MREALQRGYEQFMKGAGLIAVVIGCGLLCVSVYLHWDYSPFHHPGATPGADRVSLLRFDGVRWLMISIAGSICGVRRAPRRRSRYEQGPGAQVAYPLSVLMGVVVMAIAAFACWYYWMERLPGGDRMQNGLLAGGYFAIPAALLLTFAASLLSRPAD